MKINNILILFYILITTEKNIKSGVYNIISNELYLFYYKRKIYLTDTFRTNTFFRIIKINGSFNNTLYNIEDIEKKLKLTISNDRELIFINTKNYSQRQAEQLSLL